LPAEATLEAGRLQVLEEELQQGAAFGFIELDDSSRPVAVDVEQLSTGLGMGTDHRVDRWGPAVAIDGRTQVVHVAQPVGDQRNVMDRREALEKRAHSR